MRLFKKLKKTWGKKMKIEKLKCPKGFVLMGTDNDGYRHRYSIEKNEKFKNIFIKFMKDLGFNGKKIRQGFWTYDEEDNEFELKISDFEDCYRYYENKKHDVEVFYGNKKIIMVIRTKERRKMLDNIEYKSKWKKFPKIIKLKKDKKKIPLINTKVNIGK